MGENLELLRFGDKIKAAANGLLDNDKGDENQTISTGVSMGSLSGLVDVFPAPSDGGITSLSSETLPDFSLHQAAREGVVESVRETLKRFVDDGIDYLRVIDTIDVEGSSPLHHAARYNRKEVVELLIDHQAFLDVRGEDLNTPLHLAAKYNSLEAAKVLIQRGSQISSANEYGSTPLHFSARRGNTSISKLLINQTGVLINAKDNAEVSPLHQVAVSGDVETAELLIASGADIHATDNEGEGPIHYAAEEGNAEVIRLLVKAATAEVSKGDYIDKRNEYVNAISNEMDTALHLCCQGGYGEATEALIENGADVNAQADNLNTPLHLAAVGGHIGVAQRLLLHGARINAKDKGQMTAVHKVPPDNSSTFKLPSQSPLASLFGRTEMVAFLIDRGAKINLKDEDNYTPLLCAVWKGQCETAEFLLSKSAKLHLTDSNMKTCLHICVENAHTATLEMLLSNGAVGLINVADKDYKTPLHYAASTGLTQVIEILLEKGAKADLGSNDERTPLHMAAVNGKAKCVIILGKADPSVLNATDERGRTPLHLAALNGHTRVISALLELGAEIDGRDDIFWTPLDYAARYGFYKSLVILLSNDAPVDASDKNRNTPLHLASANGHVECVDYLLDYNADISYRNIDGKNCLDLAVENYERDVCMALVKHKRWIEAVENTDESGHQPMEKLIEVAPEVAEAVLDKCLDTSKHPLYHPEYRVTYTFKYLEVDPSERKARHCKYYGPEKMVDFRRERLLSHPVTRKFIDVKWQYLGRVPYLLNLSLYLMFVALVTAFAIIERGTATKKALAKLQPNSTVTMNTSSSTFTEVVPWLACALCIFNFGKELLQVLAMRIKYFKDINNYLELILYISTFIFMIPFLNSVSGDSDVVSEELRWSAGGVCVLFGWINLLLFLQRFPYFGLFVVMFVEILKTVLKVLSVFAIFIVAFALAFHVLLSNQKTFATPELSFMKVLVMTIGELDYDSGFTDSRNSKDSRGLPLLPYGVITYMIFAAFLILMPIIIMNLLVGLAVGDIEAVRKSSFLRILELQVDLLQDIESVLPNFLVKRAYKATYVYYPNALPWYERVRQFFGFSDQQYEFLKSKDSVSQGKEEEIQRQLECNEKELKKQKMRMKQLFMLVEEQSDLIKQMASKMGITTENDT